MSQQSRVFDLHDDVSSLTAEFKEIEHKIKTYLAEHAAELDQWEGNLTPAIKKSLSAAITKILAVPKEKRTVAQNQTLFAAGAGGVGPFRELNDHHKELDVILNQGVTTMVMKELPEPRKTTVFIKGDFTRPAAEVTPGTPAVLHAFNEPTGQSSRLHLAQWLVSPQNPLTARVIINRVWQQYFGRGIVETENDFGAQNTPPSHPELLDWLATEFVARHWSLKEMHRLIVTSHTYRQSSMVRPSDQRAMASSRRSSCPCSGRHLVHESQTHVAGMKLANQS